MSALPSNSPAIQALLEALGIPKKATSVEIQIRPLSPVSIVVKYFPGGFDSGTVARLLADFELAPVGTVEELARLEAILKKAEGDRTDPERDR